MKVSWWEMAETAWTAGFCDSQTAAAGGLSVCNSCGVIIAIGWRVCTLCTFL